MASLLPDERSVMLLVVLNAVLFSVSFIVLMIL